MKKQKKVPKGLFSRASKIIGATAQLAAKEATLKVKKTIEKNIEGTELKTRIDQALVLKDTMSELKGAAMKVGQLLSLDVSEILPPEVTQILSELQADSQAIAFSEIEAIIKNELGERFGDLEHIDPIPLASASIGQVHTAQYKGKKIVLKVQYPGVRESIPTDINMLKRVLHSGSVFVGKKVDLTSTFDEIEYVLLKETDYQNELKNLLLFKELIQDDEFFLVPEAIQELSTDRLLSMEYMEGIGLKQWIDTKPSKEDKELLSQKMLDHFFKELFEWRVIQTDPNLANFLVQPDPLNVVLLDYGACLHYSEDFINKYRNFVVLSQTGNDKQIYEASIDFEFIDPRESKEVVQAFVEMIRLSSVPFVHQPQPFDFTSLEYERQTRKVILDFTRQLKYTPPPRTIIFMHRKLGGLFNTLKKMEIKLDLSVYWEKLKQGEG